MEQNRLMDLAQALVALVVVVLAIWEETPQWQRDLIRERIRLALHRLSARVAHRSGQLAMDDELHGRPRIAEFRYQATRRLSELRDRL